MNVAKQNFRKIFVEILMKYFPGEENNKTSPRMSEKRQSLSSLVMWKFSYEEISLRKFLQNPKKFNSILITFLDLKWIVLLKALTYLLCTLYALASFKTWKAFCFLSSPFFNEFNPYFSAYLLVESFNQGVWLIMRSLIRAQEYN